MRSPKVLALLATALLVLVGAAGAIGLFSMAHDVERARLRYVERAAVLAANVCDALDAVRRELPTNAEAFTVRAAEDGTLIAPPPPDRQAADQSRAQDAQLVATTIEQIDALDRAGDDALGDARLLELAERDDRRALAAFALLWSASRAERAGRDADARTHWSAVVEHFGDERDARGLALGHVARAELLASDDASIEELARLHTDLLADLRSADDTATIALAARVAERTAQREPTRRAELEAAADEAQRPLALVAWFARGPSEWFARGAPGGARVFEFDGAPALLVVAERDEEADGYSGRALEVERVAALALARLEPGELSVAILGRGDALLAGAPPLPGAPSATLRARDPFVDLVATAFGPDFESFAASERRRFRLVAALFVGALVAAAGAGFAIVRSVTRDARRTAEREAFVAAVTHELKSPIASIRLLAELLERGDVDPGHVRDFGGRTAKEAVRLGRLIDSILGFARVEAESDVPREPCDAVDVTSAVAEAVARVAPVAQERGFELRIEPSAENFIASARRDALIGAVAELLENATKYGAPAGGVDVAMRSEETRVRIEVSDRGPGVPRSERERVFEPFRRLGDELTRERAGIGLGLALVKAAIEACGGRVGCDARRGGGACFWIELERAPTA